MMTHEINWSQEVMRARDASGLTVENLARQIGIRASLLGAIERGQLLPDDALAQRLVNCLQRTSLRLEGR